MVTDNIALSPYLWWLQALYYSCSNIAPAHPWHQNVSLPSIMYFSSVQGLWSIVLLWTQHFSVIWSSLMKQQLKRVFFSCWKTKKLSKLYSGTKRVFNITDSDQLRDQPWSDNVPFYNQIIDWWKSSQTAVRSWRWPWELEHTPPLLQYASVHEIEAMTVIHIPLPTTLTAF